MKLAPNNLTPSSAFKGASLSLATCTPTHTHTHTHTHPILDYPDCFHTIAPSSGWLAESAGAPPPAGTVVRPQCSCILHASQGCLRQCTSSETQLPRGPTPLTSATRGMGGAGGRSFQSLPCGAAARSTQPGVGVGPGPRGCRAPRMLPCQLVSLAALLSLLLCSGAQGKDQVRPGPALPNPRWPRWVMW